MLPLKGYIFLIDENKGFNLVDAPVSGGVKRAADGTLTVKFSSCLLDAFMLTKFPSNDAYQEIQVQVFLICWFSLLKYLDYGFRH